jgi:hypothetical protein
MDFSSGYTELYAKLVTDMLLYLLTIADKTKHKVEKALM